eukprot:Hpha_TRINITY_DN15473_c0_g3::TRINITY_DN15473_c0_g3_i2::g.174086::m.174086
MDFTPRASRRATEHEDGFRLEKDDDDDDHQMPSWTVTRPKQRGSTRRPSAMVVSPRGGHRRVSVAEPLLQARLDRLGDWQSYNRQAAGEASQAPEAKGGGGIQGCLFRGKPVVFGARKNPSVPKPPFLRGEKEAKSSVPGPRHFPKGEGFPGGGGGGENSKK